LRRAATAERIGRTVEPTLPDYRHALAQRGVDGVAGALIARANQRWDNVYVNVPMVGAFLFPRLWRLPVIDSALQTQGVLYTADAPAVQSPADPGPDWPHQLRWAVDTTATAGKFALLAQGVGAAALLRQQLERWTHNRAAALGRQQALASTSDYMATVWRGYPRRLDIGKVYGDMSDLLHGRGRMLEIVRWEAGALAAWPPPAELMVLAIFAELNVLIQFQVIGAMLGSLPDLAPDLQQRLVDWRWVGDPPPEEVMERVTPSVIPLTPTALTSPYVKPLVAAGKVYELSLKTLGTTDQLPEASLAVLAYLHRRHRATQAALHALEQESTLLGEDFDLEAIEERALHYVFVAEAAGLAGGWIGGPHGDSLLTAASALRSAFHLWLEDDTRSMIPVRTIYESVARARAWRLKPVKAERLEANGSRTTIRDWIGAAGWRRLAILNQALGELSHFSYESRWGGAMKALAALQEDAHENPFAMNTARGSTLDQASMLLAVEATEALRLSSPELADAVGTLTGITAGAGRAVEAWLEHASAQRGFDFGKPTFRRQGSGVWKSGSTRKAD